MRTKGQASILGAWVVAVLTVAACGQPAAETQSVAIRGVNDVPADDLRMFDATDDRDPATPGVQVSVAVEAIGDAAPTLDVGGATYTATPAADGRWAFEGVTLAAGENEIVARAGAIASSLRLYLRTPEIEVFTLAETLGCVQHDSDPATAGLQTMVGLRGHAIPDGSAVTVRVDGRSYSATLEQGEAGVEVTLPSESSEVTIHAQVEVAGQILAAERVQVIQCARCAIAEVGGHVATGSASAPVVLGQADDESEAEGMQSRVRIRQSGAAGTRVDLLVDGATVATQEAAGQDVTFAGISFADGSSVEVRCSYAGVEERLSRTVRVDLEPPPAVTDLFCEYYGAWAMCLWTQPEDPSSPGGLSGWSLRYLVESAMADEHFDDALEIPGIPLPYEAGTLMTAFFPLETGDACDASFGLRVFDTAGNGSIVSNIVSLDLCR